MLKLFHLLIKLCVSWFLKSNSYLEIIILQQIKLIFLSLKNRNFCSKTQLTKHVKRGFFCVWLPHFLSQNDHINQMIRLSGITISGVICTLTSNKSDNVRKINNSDIWVNISLISFYFSVIVLFVLSKLWKCFIFPFKAG